MTSVSSDYLSKLAFYGHESTSDGVNTREERIADIQDTKACEQYPVKFMRDAESVAGRNSS